MKQPAFFIDNEQHLTMSFGVAYENFIEPICCECDDPIKWVLDMFSFIPNQKG
jgi:hypothetical protein